MPSSGGDGAHASPRDEVGKGDEPSGVYAMVVEDDAALRSIFADALRDFGHEVRTAPDGASAMQILEQGWSPCVVFLDLRMPGMDGWEFARRLRADVRWQGIKIVVVAAHFQVDREARDVGADAWLQKPVDLWRLDEQARAQCA
jgi:CheY-like chemotaxis protein